MKVYWAVTIPLTILVVSTWLLWTRMHRLRDRVTDIQASKATKEEEKVELNWASKTRELFEGIRRRRLAPASPSSASD
ncbi:hypothetical protein K440DRAFT_628026 [Wilcoxina mikolae CBS 423.85]|nr:hypothetical protein K440DRAFT_628026 [Wilcoxina mikolae CBS 423.85]